AGARVHIPHSAALDFNPTQDYTVEFWMKAGPQATSGRTLVEKNGGTFPYSIELLPSGVIYAAARDGATTVSVTGTNTGSGAGRVDNNVWHHVAAVFKHSTKTLQLYIDGGLNASTTYAESLGTTANSQDLYFGARSDGSNSFTGILDEVDIHNGALSLAEVQSIAAAGDLGKCRPPVIATGAVSRKTHTGEGDFDVNLPLTGTTGVESRSGGGGTGDYQVVVAFESPVTVDGGTQAQVISGSGVVGSGGTANGGAVSISGNNVTIPLTNVTNAQTLGIQLNSVSNGASVADIVIPMSVLVGDTNGDRGVNAGDATQTRTRSGQPLSGTNFRSDVNTDGNVNSGDALAVKARSGTSLP
ncbi:MAG TPA: LamG-like jellyroll fold domain-containing protein, partial [Chthoniobacterales bacterium]